MSGPAQQPPPRRVVYPIRHHTVLLFAAVVSVSLAAIVHGSGHHFLFDTVTWSLIGAASYLASLLP